MAFLQDGFPVPLSSMETFTGGIFDTNCFFIPGANILIDAPQDAAQWLANRGHRVELLLLTHGHIDHVVDGARIQREHHSRVCYHRDTAPMLTDPDFFRNFGFGWEIETVASDFFIIETDSV